ncbi:MAG TPA: hypothetical protein H9743_00410 [Candidatus Mediterraneibacter vanvlietii]|nr:hypothetical protein [Candidatus Mediterraneibacter vanvlietii]
MWRNQSNGTGYKIQQFRQGENFCRIQAGEYGGIYVRQYKAEKKEEGEGKMKHKKYDPYIASIWGSMANYMEFYQAWVTICATLNRSIDNPNRVLARRWRK